jgi:hypothetical protein
MPNNSGPHPNLILLGAQKSGTTAVYNWLSQHPDIFGNAAMKDFPFFCRPDYYDHGLDWFSRHFKGHAGQRYILHGYVHYLFLGDEVAQRLFRYNPELKLLVLLRNPVERAFSGFLQARKTGDELTERFEEALQADRQGKLLTLRERVDRSYLSHGLYSNQLEQYLRYFPKSQIKVILYDKICASPKESCSEIFRFLRLDQGFEPKFTKKNAYGKTRFSGIESLIRKGVRSSSLRNILPLSMRSKIRDGLRALNTTAADKPEMEPETLKMLHDYYADEIDSLEKLTGLSLENWRQ